MLVAAHCRHEYLLRLRVYDSIGIITVAVPGSDICALAGAIVSEIIIEMISVTLLRMQYCPRRFVDLLLTTFSDKSLR